MKMTTSQTSSLVNGANNTAEVKAVRVHKSIIYGRLKNSLSVETASVRIHQCACVREAAYVGCTMRILSYRMHEHCTAWLRSKMRKTVSSAILAHLGHRIDPNTAFTILQGTTGCNTAANNSMSCMQHERLPLVCSVEIFC